MTCRRPHRILLRVLGVTVALCGAAAPPAGGAQRPTPNLEAGAKAFSQSCARCHGATGHGDGVDAKRFYPRPRDLSLGVYKFRTTASGTPPSDEDLFHTVTAGLPGSNMPDWPHLDEATRWQLVEYLKSLSPAFQQTTPAPVTIPPDPGRERADLAKGKALYAKLGCVACHGASGRANGPSAAGLVDDWGMPIRPANLTQGWNYRGGFSPRDIVTRILAGIDGAGMPSYAEAILPVDDVWHLASYVASLQEPAHWNLRTSPRMVSGALPATVDDPRWQQVEATDLRLRHVVSATGEWTRAPTVTAARVRVLKTSEAAAWLVSWDDPTQDASDAVALVLKPAGTIGDVVTLQAWPYEGAPPLDVCYWSAAQPTQAVEAVTVGFDDVRNGARGRATLTSVAHYNDGRWQLVVQRPLTPTDPKGAAPLALETLPALAVAVWDGGNPEARAVSQWMDLTPHGQ